MTSKTSKAKWVAAVAAVVMVGSAQAVSLIDRGGGMIYDPDRDITWLQDWIYAQTSGFAADGRMFWPTANDWANNLVYGGFSDWRLPTAPCVDEQCTVSELGHIFYEHLGGNVFESVLDQTGDTQEEMDNLALFTNVQSFEYWTGTVYAPDPSLAWLFNAVDGRQFGLSFLDGEFFAVAVRPGDVAAVVPEVQTYAMLLAGLGALALVVRRRPV